MELTATPDKGGEGNSADLVASPDASMEMRVSTKCKNDDFGIEEAALRDAYLDLDALFSLKSGPGESMPHSLAAASQEALILRFSEG